MMTDASDWVVFLSICAFVHLVTGHKVRVLVCRSLRDCAPRGDSARSFYEPCCDSGSLEAAHSQALISTATEKCGVIGNQTCESRHGFRALSGRAAVYQARPFMPHPRGLGVNLMDLRRLIQENMKLAGNAFSIRSDLLFVSPARRTLSFVMENFEHPCKTRQSHLTSTHVPKWTNKKIFNAWLHYQIAG